MDHTDRVQSELGGGAPRSELAGRLGGRGRLWLLAGLLCGYGFAWLGHFAFEKNQPATFRRPLYSFMGDWAMYRDILTGKVRV